MNLSELNAPFFFPGGEPGVLLVHGFLSSPLEMRGLGERLAEAGMTVAGIRLRGHGTDVDELESVHRSEWDEDVSAGLAELRRHCNEVSIVGHSLGGALALRAAARGPIDRVVACSAPDNVLSRRLPLRVAELVAPYLQRIPKVGSDIHEAEARAEHYHYDAIPLHSVLEVTGVLQSMRDVLPCITTPTLLIQSKNDLVVPSATACRIAVRTGGPAWILWVERGGHNVLVDTDREPVTRAIESWLRGEIPPGAEAPRSKRQA